MSNRLIIQDGLEVHANDLLVETSARIQEDNQRLLDEGSAGVATGLNVTINMTTASLVDISSGRGYAPNGELIIVPSNITSVALKDYSATTVNYIILMYTETPSVPRTHETNGSSPFVQSLRSFRVVVYTSTQFSGLQTTNPDLTQDSQDRALVVATVVAQGYTAGVPNALIQGGIIPAAFFNASHQPLTITPASPARVTGVEYTTATDPGSTFPSLGTGSITLVVPTSNALTTSTLAWHGSIGGDSTGSAVTITAPGSYALVSTLGQTLAVQVSPELFPGIPGTYTETITLGRMTVYSPYVAHAMSAKDLQHRLSKGNLAQSNTNEHGIRGTDISNVLRVQQGVVLGTGLTADAARGLVPRLSASASSGGNRDLLSEWTGSQEGVVTRQYLIALPASFPLNPALDVVVTTVNARWDGTNWNKDWTGATATMAWSSNSGEGLFYQNASTQWGDSSWLVQNINSFGVGLEEGFGAVSSYQTRRQFRTLGGFFSPVLTDATNSAFYSDINSGTSSRWLVSDISDFSTGIHCRRYAEIQLPGANESGFEETINARWDGTNWNRDFSGYACLRRTTATRETVLFIDASATSSWSDTVGVGGWTSKNVEIISGFGGTLPTVLRDGFISFGTGVSSTNPGSSTGFANTICAKSSVKAWGLISLNGASAPTVLDGFNINNTVAFNGPNNGVTVTFQTPLATSTHPMVLCNLLNISASGNPVPQAGSYFIAYPGSVTNTAFDLDVMTQSGSSMAINASGASGYQINFIVYGIQS